MVIDSVGKQKLKMKTKIKHKPIKGSRMSKHSSDNMDQQIIWLNEDNSKKNLTKFAGDDVVELNVQGTLFYTTRYTLTQVNIYIYIFF